MAELLKGAAVAEGLSERARDAVATLKEQGVLPTLAILRVGERDDDLSYERGAIKRCESVGVAVKQVLLPIDVDQETMLKTIADLNEDASVHGVLMFRPLPKQLDETELCEALAPEKDVDSITTGSLASVFTGAEQGFAPCTAQACIEILDYYKIDLKGKRAVVIGRSLVIGRPVAMLLMARNATITICHTRTVDMPSITREADIVIVAAGRMETIGAEYFSEGQTVIDVGIGWNEEKAKLCGDVVFDDVEPLVGAITPVPGGVGAVTTSVLVSHTIEAAMRGCGLC